MRRKEERQLSPKAEEASSGEVRYAWLNISPKSVRMEQAFSADGGETWETNWICDLSR
jgi:hypothetical protein